MRVKEQTAEMAKSLLAKKLANSLYYNNNHNNKTKKSTAIGGYRAAVVGQPLPVEFSTSEVTRSERSQSV